MRRLGPEGVWRESGPVLEIEGQAWAVPSGERPALNFLQRLSGVATQAACYARAVEGTGARILDTRKTTPGMRRLEKQAVAAAGALNDRAGLYDAILIKENHATMAGGVGTAVRREREAAPELPLEVECRDLAEVEDALAAGAPRILLDNMTPAQRSGGAGRRARRARGQLAASTSRRFGRPRPPA